MIATIKIPSKKTSKHIKYKISYYRYWFFTTIQTPKTYKDLTQILETIYLSMKNNL